jgi:hypothetical protein
MIWTLKTACVFALVLFLLSGSTSSDLPYAPANGEKKTTIMIANGDLSVLFRDNSTSPQVLSGIHSLFNGKNANDSDAYDPDSNEASAGMNFERIISGHRNTMNKFCSCVGKVIHLK